MKKIANVILFTLIINMILNNFLMKHVTAQVLEGYEFVTIDEEIEDIKEAGNNLLINLSDGKAKIVKDNEINILEGTGYHLISNDIVINDNGKVFNITKAEFESEEKSSEIITNISTIYEQLKLLENESIYLVNDKLVVIKETDEVYQVTYYKNENNTYIVESKIENINAQKVSFSKNGDLIIFSENKVFKYIDGQSVEQFEIPDGYKATYIDGEKYVLFNEYKYGIINASDLVSDEINKEINTEVNTEINDENSELEDDTTIKSSDNSPSVLYETHVQSIGWQGWKSNGQISGTSGQAKRLEGIKIKVEGLPEDVNITYRTHVQSYGWQEWKKNGEVSGTEGQAKRLEGIEIKLENAPSNYHIKYRVHVQGIGWQEWKTDGETAGTSGQSRRLEAIEIKLVTGEEVTELGYSTYVSNEGWKGTVSEGNTSGSSSNNKLEAIKINLTDTINNMSIQYRTHIQSSGWGSWNGSGVVSGNVGSGKRLEAIEIKLVNAPSDYHIAYRTNIKGHGWQGWTKDGQTSGTTGVGSEIIGIQIKLVKDITNLKVNYQTHIQSYGWQNWQSNGSTSGTVGKAKRLEGIKITVDNLPENNSILYRTHVQSYGWQDWKKNGELSGTSGESKRLEAIQIKLEKPIDGYKLYYRVHVQGIGWQEWKSEGESAGTSGQSKRLEAIEIKFVKDRYQTIVVDPGHNYGGDDGAYATHGSSKYIERDLNMQVALKLKKELELKGFEVMLTRKPEDRENLAMRESLKKRVNYANNLDADFFISIHQNAAISSSVTGVECYYSSATPLNASELLPRGLENENIRAYNSSYKLSKSSQISSALVTNISSKMGRKNRGSIDDDFFVVKNTYMPSVLLECGFITNRDEASKLANSSLQQKMSEIIADELSKAL